MGHSTEDICMKIRHRYTNEVLFTAEEAANMVDALKQAIKAGANLYGANLYGADLEGSNLKSANLYGADLEDANLEDANLKSANAPGSSRTPRRPSRAARSHVGSEELVALRAVRDAAIAQAAAVNAAMEAMARRETQETISTGHGRHVQDKDAAP
jgi:hypothetical protein